MARGAAAAKSAARVITSPRVITSHKEAFDPRIDGFGFGVSPRTSVRCRRAETERWHLAGGSARPWDGRPPSAHGQGGGSTLSRRGSKIYTSKKLEGLKLLRCGIFLRDICPSRSISDVNDGRFPTPNFCPSFLELSFDVRMYLI